MARAKFSEIKQHILNAIEDGSWASGSKLPSENQLAEEFCCSRMTARRAVTELTEQGVLERSQGLGTFVAGVNAQSSMLVIRNIADEIRERGHEYSVRQIVLRKEPALPEVAAALEIETGSEVYYSMLIHFEQQKPLQLEYRYINPKIAPNYLQQDFLTITPHEYLSQAAPLTEAHHKVQAIIANDVQKQQLKLEDQTACLQILRRTWSRKGVVSFARLVHPGNRFHLGGHLTF
ncbi:histidine utilization repressor [Parashewanella curva]|uniref:Histidine utilization repressor n=1 Tax=Parashewanella curva TaxID=2338552 RepID=A0A3L8PTZ0_9GAMM|nr:histidine utilization repressor [Parashewanella curva]RLV58279.1 histidine utilization repressor [Parashewanella curva]